MKPTIAVVGGTGALGLGLALRWTKAGYDVVIGSRREEAGTAAAQEIIETLGDVVIEPRGMTNQQAAAQADVVVIAVPFAQQADALDQLAGIVDGKIVIDTTVPLVPPKVGTVQLPATVSSAQGVQARLGDSVMVVSAFQNVSAKKLRALSKLECDVLVTSDHPEARDVVIELCNAIGTRGHNAGPLANAIAAEALTSILITLNRQYKCESGIRITGLDN